MHDRVLSRPALLEAREQGWLFLEPFDERYLKGSSVDVRLGEWYFAEQEPRWQDLPALLNPWDKASVRSMWGEARKAAPLDRDLLGIPRGTPVIIIPPGGVFLGHTHEFVGSLSGELTFMVKARSTTGRNRVRICSCAGLGDPGFAHRLTLELANDSQYRSVILVPGRRIGQIIFMPTTTLPEADLYFKTGKYMRQTPVGKTFAELEAAWSPDEMLPQAYLDWELA